MTEPLTAVIGRNSRAAGLTVDAGSGLRFHLDERTLTSRERDRSFRIRVVGSRPPADLERVRIRALLATGEIDETLDASPNLTWSHPWDGTHLDGAITGGSAIAPVRVGWVRSGDGSAPRRTEWWERTAVAGAWDARMTGLGGLVPHGLVHLEPDASILWSGNGRRRTGVDIIRATHRRSRGLEWVPARNEDLLLVDGPLVHVFLGDGRHLRSFDRMSRRERFRLHHDPAERIIGWTLDERLRFRLDRDDGAIIVRSPEVAAVRIALDTAGRVASITDTTGAHWRFGFEPSGLLDHAVDPMNRWVRVGHDPDGAATTLVWSTGERSDTIVDEQSEIRRVRILTGAGRESSETRRRIGPATTEIRSRCCGATAETVTVRMPGRRETVKPDGTRIVRRERVERAGGGTIRTRRTTIRTPGGRTTERIERQHVDTTGIVVEEREQAGAMWRLRHDPHIGVTTEHTPMGRETRSEIDDTGTRRWSGAGRVSVEQHHDSGRPVRIRIGGSVRELAYDELGRIVEAREGTEVRRFRYDSAGRLEAEHTGTGWLEYERDAVGRIVATTTPSGDTTRFVLDPDGIVTARIRPTDTGPVTETFTHDRDRLVVASTIADEEALVATRDSAGRIIRMRAGDDSIEQTWDDRTGQLVRLQTDAGDVIEPIHDGYLLVGERVRGAVTGEVHIAHDDAHRPSAVTVDGLTAPIERDADGSITAYGPVRFDRSGTSGLVHTVRAGALVTRRVHDDTGAIVAENTRFGDHLVFAEEITRDERGRITRVVEQTPERTRTIDHRYDETGRLVAVDVDGNPHLALTYDANDNLIRLTGPNRSDELTVGVGDRPRSFRGAPVEVDVAGRVTEQDGRRIDHDGFGRTREVRTADGHRVRYRRDARGKLIEVSVDDEVRWKLLRADGRIAAFVDTSGRRLRTAPSGYQPAPAALFDDRRVLRLITDHRGSVRRVVDAVTGEILQAIDHDPLGAIVHDSNPGFQPFGYAGSVHDPFAHLVHTGERELDPSTSRFLQPDPLDLAGGQTNLYAYAGNDPVNRHDPNGLQAGIMRDMPGPEGGVGPVEICKVKIFSGERSTTFSRDHVYFKWGETRRGMGPTRGGRSVKVLGERFPQSEWENETNVDAKRQNEQCREIEDVDLECLDDYTTPGGDLGIWAPGNVCWDAVWDALDHCSDGNWKFRPKRDADDPTMPSARAWGAVRDAVKGAARWAGRLPGIPVVTGLPPSF